MLHEQLELEQFMQDAEFMDKHLENNKASVRKAMIEQEEIFKYQVQELHRVYDTQKILMTISSRRAPELPLNVDKQKIFDAKTSALSPSPSASDSTNSSSLSARNYLSAAPAFQNQEKFNQEHDIDLTLSIGSSSARKV